MGKYAAEGTGVNAWATRKNIYTAVIVVAAVALAVVVTMGFISIDQINSFIQLVLVLVGILGSLVGLVAAALARANVEPPQE